MLENLNLRVIILGSGSSTGVPVIGCKCRVCQSPYPKNTRLRSSLYLYDERHKQSFLIDTSPDLRFQLLKNKITNVDHVLYTHTHADHCHGFDDLRILNFLTQKPIDCWLSKLHLDDLKKRFSYAFTHEKRISASKPQVKLNELKNNSIKIGDRTIEFILLPHGNTNSVAFLFDNFLYATDFKSFPKEMIDKWRNKVDFMLASGATLENHPTHSSVFDTVKLMQQFEVQKGYITHLSHKIDYYEDSKHLPSNINFVYDGMTLEF